MHSSTNNIGHSKYSFSTVLHNKRVCIFSFISG